ncbi:pilus assembly protein TadG-related protein [Geobacter sp. DSM 9736]|uniref:pilus assembly protein TadG-related protein n=1 Tax=Geobacter sp. DSM 9736 TaxID=1277350 RepID=UPI000B50621A|nr:pilus assembly protein TadG-related protein [Geobacter sp. DSM 9736]SNB46554.1 Putative Tad-like Flp pilus-assembly [Geobacter sp. DSM 9736]
MDTTYINTLLVVFLVVAALAIDVGYLYVSEEDLHNAAETAALTGTQVIKQRIQEQIHADPSKIRNVTNDTVQTSARTAAIDTVSGKHRAVALMDIVNNNSNQLTTSNDITVGFWNISTHTYTPGASPVNAMQVRTRRTAESDTVGFGSVGAFIARISGVEKFHYTPEAVAAFPPRANANFALCMEACESSCTYPNVCSIPERKMVRDPSDQRKEQSAGNLYAYTSLLYPPTGSTNLSDLICMELPPQEVCGKQIFTSGSADNGWLRDMESMMYNPNADKSNKEMDGNGDVRGWWVIAPVTKCSQGRQEGAFEGRAVSAYALVRISKICASGATGCKQNYTAFDGPGSCGNDNSLYIDRISCISCSSEKLLQFPGLHPVVVK